MASTLPAAPSSLDDPPPQKKNPQKVLFLWLNRLSWEGEKMLDGQSSMDALHSFLQKALDSALKVKLLGLATEEHPQGRKPLTSTRSFLVTLSPPACQLPLATKVMGMSFVPMGTKTTGTGTAEFPGTTTVCFRSGPAVAGEQMPSVGSRYTKA